jgi:hypothetical protein
VAVIFKDGSFGSSASRLRDTEDRYPFIPKGADFSLLKARVDEVIYVDDNRNPTKGTNNEQVVYICTLLSGSDVGQKVANVVDSPWAGGAFVGSERIRHPMFGKDFSGDTPKTPPNSSGEVVVLGRIGGQIGSYVILGSLKHPKFKTAAKKADGQRCYWEYNGVVFQINRDGELSVTFGGGPKNPDDGKAPNDSSAGSTLVFSKNGNINIKDKDGNGLLVDAENKSVSLVSGTGGSEMNIGGPWTVNVQGNATIKASGAVELDGSLVNIVSGGLGAARLNDLVTGWDAEGRPLVNTRISGFSTKVLIGG